MFEAPPLVALPPFVLLLTVAVPEAALWLFVLVTVTMLLFITFTLLVLVLLMVLFELGPVLLMEPLWFCEGIAMAAAELAAFETDTDPLKPFALEAIPDVAPPAFVLFVVLAAPELAP